MSPATGVHQVVAGAAPRDAITNHVIAARREIRAMGLRSEIFCDPRHIAGDLVGDIHPATAWGDRAARDDLAILHYSIDSPAFSDIARRSAGAAVHYHNVTPPDLLWRDAPALALQCRNGRTRLRQLAQRVTSAAADSQFNADELATLGFPDADVIGVFRQPLPDVTAHRTAPWEPGTRMRILFVGRGAPNKCQHDAIAALGALTQAGLAAELRLVGSWGGNRAYLARCLRMADSAGVGDRVVFAGSVSDHELAREYATAHVFLCLSEHEGYCVPLLEAMDASLPIVGFAAGAVPETLGRAGLLVGDKSAGLVAEALVAAASGDLDDALAAGRLQQTTHHATGAIAERLRTFVNGFVGRTC